MYIHTIYIYVYTYNIYVYTYNIYIYTYTIIYLSMKYAARIVLKLRGYDFKASSAQNDRTALTPGRDNGDAPRHPI